jgi:hypothetical protein
MTFHQLKNKLHEPVDNSFLIVFRITFGLIMLWDIIRYWSNGWVDKLYIKPHIMFKYYGFEWVHAWPGDGMIIHFAALALLALFITIGFLYRISIVLFFFGFSYVFLLDQANYLNHFYLVILFNFLLIFLPANKSFSVDALIWTKNKSDKAPLWSLWILRFQLEVVYIYAGIVKINADWLQLEPLSSWLSYRADMPVVGYLYTQDWAVAIAAYGVIILHIVGAPLLLWKRTRLVIFSIYACFHILNHFTFTIGIFPWLTLAATLVFFDPVWPKQFKNHVLKLLKIKTNTGGAVAASPTTKTAQVINVKEWNRNLVFGLCTAWALFQILVPLRHTLYPGNVSWTEEGHRFAWQMKLRTKRGFADFAIFDPATQKTWYVSPEEYLTKKQARKMPTQPDMILQFAHFLEDKWIKEHKLDKVEIRVNNYVSLNGRELAPMINPTVDLTKIERSLSKADWILPLQEPLRRNLTPETGSN